MKAVTIKQLLIIIASGIPMIDTITNQPNSILMIGSGMNQSWAQEILWSAARFELDVTLFEAYQIVRINEFHLIFCLNASSISGSRLKCLLLILLFSINPSDDFGLDSRNVANHWQLVLKREPMRSSTAEQWYIRIHLYRLTYFWPRWIDGTIWITTRWYLCLRFVNQILRVGISV